MLEKNLGNVIKDSEECPRRFPGMLLKIPGNVPEDSGELSSRFRGIFGKVWGIFKLIPRNLSFDLFLEILLVFYQISLLKYYKTMEKKTVTEQSL